MPCFLDLAFLLLNLFQFLLLFIHSTHNRSGSSVFYLPSKLSALFLYSMRYRLSSYVIQFFQIFSLTFYSFYALCTWQSCNLIFFTFSFNYLPNLINTDLVILLFDLTFFSLSVHSTHYRSISSVVQLFSNIFPSICLF